MEPRDAHRDVLVPEEPCQLPALRRADAIRRAQREWGASGGVRRDAAADALVRVLPDVRYAEKLADLARDVQAEGATHPVRPEAAQALCIPDAAQSAA
jgi:hypothetical protein